jgi:hypothetical protein
MTDPIVDRRVRSSTGTNPVLDRLAQICPPRKSAFEPHVDGHISHSHAKHMAASSAPMKCKTLGAFQLPTLLGNAEA